MIGNCCGSRREAANIRPMRYEERLPPTRYNSNRLCKRMRVAYGVEQVMSRCEMQVTGALCDGPVFDLQRNEGLGGTSSPPR